MTAIEELRRLLGKLPNPTEALALLDEVELERVAVPAGWRLVPAKCTGQMADAGAGVDRRLSVFKAADIYRAMLDAAPQPASQPQEAAQMVPDAVALAYGLLWHVNAGMDAPAIVRRPSLTPEKAACEARKVLRSLMTKEQRGDGINAAYAMLTAPTASGEGGAA